MLLFYLLNFVLGGAASLTHSFGFAFFVVLLPFVPVPSPMALVPGSDPSLTPSWAPGLPSVSLSSPSISSSTSVATSPGLSPLKVPRWGSVRRLALVPLSVWASGSLHVRLPFGLSVFVSLGPVGLGVLNLLFGCSLRGWGLCLPQLVPGISHLLRGSLVGFLGCH